MHIDIIEKGAFSSALVQLQPGEKFISEAGAMYRASGNVDIDVTMQSRGQGGFFSGLKRLFASEGIFFSTYTTTDGRPGEVGLAPVHLGEIRQVRSDGQTAWLCTGGSYLGSTEDILVETKFQGLKGLFTGESISFLRLSGTGEFLCNAFGRIVEIDVKDALTVDTGHVVAFQESLQYKLSKAGGSWFQSFLAGEGIVLNFTGRGKILVQSHNPNEFGKSLGPKLPPRD